MTTYTVRIGIVGLLFSTLAVSARADYSINEQLQKFQQNTKNFMESQESVQKFEQKYKVTKRDKKTGQPLQEQLESESPIEIGQYSKFSKEEIKNLKFVDVKSELHEGLATDAKGLKQHQEKVGRAEYDKTVDNPATLVEDGIVLGKLEQMDGQYQNASLAQSPWSDDYWPIYLGGVAKRYNDTNYMEAAKTTDWKTIADYIMTTNASSVDDLSPAEKYDILVGDSVGDKTDIDKPGWGLTKAMLREGRGYYNALGKDGQPVHKVERWMGHCHGWAAAAYMERRPLHSIQVMAADGKTKLTFYPSDIKALASLMWAQAKTPNNFVGTRCNVKNPETDENGRILDQTCFDTNPGTWHLAVVNQLGYYKKSFVLDATYDFEVWNQPAFGYEYKYFNPKQGKEVTSLSAARIETTKVIDGKDGKKHATFDGDKFAEYRSEKAKYIVGVAMKFTYIAETAPSKTSPDVQDSDRRVAVNYLYDIELDADKNIIGGEWYNVKHPDFMWSPSQKTIKGKVVRTKALSQGDQQLDLDKNKDHWKDRHEKPAPKLWREAAIAQNLPEATQNGPTGQPLTRIVKELIQKSNQIDFELMGTRHWNRSNTGVEERF